MRVLADYKTFQGYKYKGIITAYWMNGHRGLVQTLTIGGL